MNTCENCGCRVYRLGCVNCDELNYIEAQGEPYEPVYAGKPPKFADIVPLLEPEKPPK